MQHEANQDQGINDTRESNVSRETGSVPPHGQTEPPINIDPKARLGRGFFIAIAAAVIVVGVIVFMGIEGRLHAEEKLTVNTDHDAVMSVAVISPSHGADAMEITLPANTQAFLDTPIYARTNGYLQHWFADIGTHVRRGDVLAQIETPELDQQVQQAQSDLATAQSNEQIAKITAERWKKLLAKNAVSVQEADQASSDMNARESAVASAEANVRRLQQMQGFEKVYAPFDGVITARNVDVGSLIQAGDSNTPKSELFHIASTDKLRLFVPVPEVYARNVHDGQHIAITSDAFPNQKFEGIIARNAEAIDITSRTLNVEVDVVNTNHTLLPGQYAFVHLPIPAGTSSMTLPSNVLLFRGEGLRVGVVRDNQVSLVPVQVGHDYGAKVEIVSGLTPQDQVIVNPSDSLAQGQRVHVEKEGAE